MKIKYYFVIACLIYSVISLKLIFENIELFPINNKIYIKIAGEYCFYKKGTHKEKNKYLQKDSCWSHKGYTKVFSINFIDSGTFDLSELNKEDFNYYQPAFIDPFKWFSFWVYFILVFFLIKYIKN